jgi:hypothetical protein
VIKLTTNVFPRRTAKIVGILFMIGTFGIFIGQAFYDAILSSPEYLEITYPNRITVITGILVETVGYLGLVFIPLLLYPILKKHNEALALAYICFRLFESVLLSVAQIIKLSIIGLSQDYLNNGGVDTSYFHNMGNSIQSVLYWVDSGGLISIVVFVIGALVLYYELYKTKLVPRWLSIWGLFSGVALVAGSLLFTLDIITAGLAVLLMIPLAVQEQVMALWMIIKGFNQSTLLPEPSVDTVAGMDQPQ